LVIIETRKIGFKASAGALLGVFASRTY